MFPWLDGYLAGWRIYLATAIVLTLLIYPVSAQTTSTGVKSADKFIVTNLNGITVTATRTSRKTNEIPESVSVVDIEQIRARQAADIGDVLRYLPNVELGGGPRNLGMRPAIRGMDDDRILFLLDGARQDFNRGHNARIFTDPSLLKRVDVMRGPASAVWGSGALGGVVSFTTLDATDLLRSGESSGIKTRGGFQSMNEQYIPGISAYGLLGEQVDYLLDFSYRNAADDIRLGDGSKLRNSSFESYASLVKLNWTPGDHHFTFSTQTFDQAGKVPSNPQIASTDDTLLDRDTEQRNYMLRYRYMNADNTWLNPEMMVYHNTTYSLEKRLFDQRRDETSFSTTGINARNSSRLDLNHFVTQFITYGVDYFHNESEGKRNGTTRSEFPRGSADVAGVFLQDEITLWERLSLIPGVRWDYFHSQADDITIRSNKNNRVNIKIGGLFKVTEWLSITGGYSEAFRAPTLSELFTTGTHFTCGPGCANLFTPNPNLKPETAFNKEIGARIEKTGLLLENDQLTMRGTYFHNKVKGFVDLMVDFVFHPVPGNPGRGGTTSRGNVNDALLEGFEIEANYAAKYGYTGFSYAQTRGHNRTDGGVLSNVQPDKWIVLAGLNWPTYNLSLGWRSSIVSAQNRIPAKGTPTPGHTLHDLTLTWLPQGGTFKGIRLDFGIDNLTDKDYRRHLSVLKDPGRNYKFAVSYQF